jgi:hypothetical protein
LELGENGLYGKVVKQKTTDGRYQIFIVAVTSSLTDDTTDYISITVTDTVNRTVTLANSTTGYSGVKHAQIDIQLQKANSDELAAYLLVNCQIYR